MDPRLPGDRVVELAFSGGPTPSLVVARSPQGSLEGGTAAEVVTLLDRMHDVEVEAVGTTRSQTQVDLARGVRLTVDAGTVVTLYVAVGGPPGAMVLERPVVVSFGGDGVRVEHEGLAGVSRWIDLRLSRFTLAPDGEVRFSGRGARAVDLAVQGGLRIAAARVTHLVRSGQRFRSMLPYLRVQAAGGSGGGGDRGGAADGGG